jgi:hypothetical protein
MTESAAGEVKHSSLCVVRNSKINSSFRLDCLDLTKHLVKNVLCFSSCKRPKQSLQTKTILICEIVLEMLAADRSHDPRSKLSVRIQYSFVSIRDQNTLALGDRWDSDAEEAKEVLL